MPQSLLSALLAKTGISDKDTCLLFNLTGYDGWLEKTAKKWPTSGTPAVQFKSMTFSNKTSTAEYVEKALALELMQDLLLKSVPYCFESSMMLVLPRSRFEFISPSHSWQEWKSGNHTTLGKVRPYEANPPPSADGAGPDPTKYPLKLVKLEVDPNPQLKGWEKMKLSIPPAARARHLDDPVYGPSGRDLLAAFDQKIID